MTDKKYVPLSSRVTVPHLVGPGVAGVIDIEVRPRADFLGYVRFDLALAGVMQDLGVRILDNSILLYPAPGSVSGAGVAGYEMFGALPPSGMPLEIPFNQRFRGKPSTLRFEFYNVNAADVPVNILIACYDEVAIKQTGERREEKKVEK